MGRIRAIGHRRALIGVIAVAALALAACMPTNPPRPPVPPVAAFSASTAPLVASFTDQSTGVVNTRSWDFGDGQTSTEQNPTHTYTTHGVYAVALTVTGPGGTNTATQNVTVNPPAPVASFTSEPPSGTVPLTVFLSNTSTGLVDSIAWDLNGDGLFDDATGPTATKTFDTAGDHTVGLSVTGPGGTSTTSKAIPVTLPPPPVASFTAIPTSGIAPLTVQFSDTSTGAITGRSWDFNGDGVTDDAAQSPTHVFDAPGSYSVVLTVTGLGGTNTTTQTITVNVPAPVAAFNAAPITGTAPLTVQLTDTSSGDITSRAWTIGNQTISGPGVPLTFSRAFEEAGTYPVTLTFNGPGGGDTVTHAITVTPAPPAAPVAGFTRIPAGGGFAPLPVNFTDTSTGTITSRAWTFGDGGTSTALNPSHTYGAGGFTITLTVTGPGGSDSFSQPIVVSTPGGGGDPCPGRCEPPPGDPGGPPDQR